MKKGKGKKGKRDKEGKGKYGANVKKFGAWKERNGKRI